MSKRIAGRLVQTYGGKNGQCNICGSVGLLTEDHSPPKSCYRPKAVQVRHIVELLNAESRPTEKIGRILQNGLKFRTLCQQCNNDYLGLRYDPALASFTNTVANFLTSSMTLPEVASIRGNPQWMMRSIFGHVAAQGVGRYLKGKETEQLVDWFKDDTQPLPEGIRFYYWPFPYHDCIVFRDAAYLHIPSGDVCVIWLLKFFPVSFLMTFEKTPQPMFNLPRLSNYHDLLPVEVDLPLILKDIPQRYWPEAPAEDSVITFGREAMFAVPHIKNLQLSI